MNKSHREKLDKESHDFVNLPFWDTYYYSSTLLKKKLEDIVLKNLDKNKKYKILDYGCGVRPYEYVFRPYKSEYIGVDVGNNPHADHNINPEDRLPLNDEEFDLVMSSQVLEHVENVELYLSECNRVLKKGGLLILSTHGTWQFHSAPVDVQRWTSYGLRKLIEKYGFNIKDFIPSLGQLALTSQLRLTFFHSFVKEVFKPLKILYYPVSFLYQIKMRIEDAITPLRVKERDSAYYIVTAEKK
ncbi:MAG: methyltransferase domain-containing protein [Ignavibacteria bacterium]